jgi:hypothetical protein
MTSTVTIHGPLFDGQARGIISDMCDDIAEAVADDGRELVLINLNDSLQTQTPYYTTMIDIHPDDGPHSMAAGDNGVVYGPWLEGIGSRNAPVTRFKGYASFRRAAQGLEQTAGATAQRVAEPYIARLG